jgi:hypothetical protein
VERPGARNKLVEKDRKGKGKKKTPGERQEEGKSRPASSYQRNKAVPN